MKIDELKLRVSKFLNEIVDLYFPGDGLGDRLKNMSAKFWLEQHMGDFDGVLNSFAKDGDLDIPAFMNKMENDLFKDGTIKLNIRDILPKDMGVLKDMVPQKIIVLSKEDLHRILS